MSARIAAERKQSKGGTVEEKKYRYNVPSLYKTMFLATVGDFLSLRDSDEEGAYEQFVGENVNLALISALLLTTFIPLYYEEANKLNVPDDGFTLSVDMGAWSRFVIPVNRHILHSFFDVTYSIATTSMFLATLSCVYNILMSNEAGNDTRVIIFRKNLGILSRFPYFFFAIGAYAFGFAIGCHFFITPRFQSALAIKVIICFSLITVFVFVLLFPSHMALYTAFAEEERHPPLDYTTEQLETEVEQYFTEVQSSGSNNLNLDDFLKYLRKTMTPKGYHVPLTDGTALEASRIFYDQLARKRGTSAEHLVQLQLLLNKK